MQTNQIYFDTKTSQVVYAICDGTTERGNKIMLVREYGTPVVKEAIAILESEWPRFKPFTIDVTGQKASLNPA